MKKLIKHIETILLNKKRAYFSKVFTFPKVKSCVDARKSQRNFHKVNIPFSYIHDIISTSLNFPCPENIQNTHIIHIKNKDTIEKIAELSHNQLWIRNSSNTFNHHKGRYKNLFSLQREREKVFYTINSCLYSKHSSFNNSI